MSDSHPVDAAQGRGFDEKLVVLKGNTESKKKTNKKRRYEASVGQTYVALFEFVDVVFARDHESLAGVAQVADDVEEDAGIGAAAADVARADGDAILCH